MSNSANNCNLKDEMIPSSRLSEKNDDTEQAPERTTPKYVPPNGGYGWVVVATGFFINMHTWGINSVSLLGGFRKLADLRLVLWCISGSLLVVKHFS